ncbi:MAG: amino acid permease [Candidatus Omnitrophota bacterium]
MANGLKNSGQKPSLLKVLGLWDSVALAVGIVIGVGIFRVPAEVARYLPYPELILLAWIIGGTFSIVGASCYGELSSSFPETGGDYVYLKESYGPFVGFLYGWSGILVVRTGVIAAVAFIFAEYFVSFLGLDRSLVKLTAVAIVLLLSFINVLGLREGKRIQNISVIAKALALITIIACGIFSGKGDVSNFHHVPIPSDLGIIPLFGLALIPILWAYGGWHENTFVTGETKDARRVLPMALITGTLIIIFFYLCMNLVYIYLVPVDKMANANLIVSNVMHILYGKWAKKAVEVLVIISAFGGLNGTIITSSRITYALGKDNRLFAFLGKVDKRFKTPAIAITVNALWGCVLIIWGTFNKLLFFMGVLVWLFFAIIVAGIFVLRYKFPDMERPFKAWGYPVAPIMFVLVCIWLVVNSTIHYPLQALAGFGLMFTGVPFYFISRFGKHSGKL